MRYCFTIHLGGVISHPYQGKLDPTFVKFLSANVGPMVSAKEYPLCMTVRPLEVLDSSHTTLDIKMKTKDQEQRIQVRWCGSIVDAKLNLSDWI